jgi:antitoxin HigA-1
LRTITNNGATKRHNGLPPIHPGEILREDVLPSAGLSVTAAAKSLCVSRQMLHGILAGRKPLSAVMCLKIARLFGGSPELWVRLQATYDLKKSAQNKKIMARVARIVPLAGVEMGTWGIR